MKKPRGTTGTVKGAGSFSTVILKMLFTIPEPCGGAL
jgi:hypothetical protein